MAKQWQDLLDSALREDVEPPVSAEELRASLRRVRTLNGPAEQPWESAGFDWLEAVAAGKVNRADEVLKILLDAGLDPNDGIVRPDKIDRPGALVEVQLAFHRAACRDNPRSSRAARRLQASSPWPLQGRSSQPLGEGQHGLTWLARTVWTGRRQPSERLVAWVHTWLDAGADPHRSTGNWSAWPVALASGRIDALEAMASRVPADSRPPDWANAVSIALGLACAPKAGVDPAAVLAAVDWFARTYPPTPQERSQVYERLNAEPSAMVAWLTLPVAGLAASPGLPDAPLGFNPWAVVGQIRPGWEAIEERLLDALLAHPVWQDPQRLALCPLSSRSAGWSGAPAQARVVDAWALEGHVLSDQASTDQACRLRRRLLALADRWDLALSPAFPQLLAAATFAPDEITTGWLRQRRAQWAQCPATGATVWHHQPSALRLRRWLLDEGVTWATPDRQGTNGLAGLAWQDLSHRAKEGPEWAWLIEQCAGNPQALDTPVQGLPLGAWLGAQHRLVAGLGHQDLQRYPEETLRCAVRWGNDKAWVALAGPAPNALAARPLPVRTALLWDWAAPAVRPDENLFSPHIGQGRTEILARMGENLEAVGVPLVALKGWFSAMYNNLGPSRDVTRPDLLQAWSFLYPTRWSQWDPADQTAVAQWFAGELGREVRDRPAALGQAPWTTPLWQSWPAQEKTELIAAVVGTVVRLTESQKVPWALDALHGLAERLWPSDAASFWRSLDPPSVERLRYAFLDVLPRWAHQHLTALPPQLDRWTAIVRAQGLEQRWTAPFPRVSPPRF